MLESIKKSLKKDGQLLLIEYKGEDPAVAIRPLHKTTVAQLNKELAANGFKLTYEGNFLPIQHFLMYEKTDYSIIPLLLLQNKNEEKYFVKHL